MLCWPCSELTQSCCLEKGNGRTRHGTAAGAGLGAPPGGEHGRQAAATTCASPKGSSGPACVATLVLTCSISLPALKADTQLWVCLNVQREGQPMMLRGRSPTPSFFM